MYEGVSLLPKLCRQLFLKPHPPRLACPAPPDPSTLLPPAANASTSTAGTALSLALLTTILAATASDTTQTAASAEVNPLPPLRPLSCTLPMTTSLRAPSPCQKIQPRPQPLPPSLAAPSADLLRQANVFSQSKWELNLRRGAQPSIASLSAISPPLLPPAHMPKHGV